MEELENPPSFDDIMDEDFKMINELTLLASKIKKEVCVVFHSFLSFLKKYVKRKPHNMLFMMLDPSFKGGGRGGGRVHPTLIQTSKS